MAIADSRLFIEESNANNSYKADFQTLSESSKYIKAVEIPSAFNRNITTDTLNNYSGNYINTSKNISKISNDISNMSFSNSMTSNELSNVVNDSMDSLSKTKSILGGSIGSKSAIDLIFGDCPYDGFNLNYQWGLLNGLFPSLGSFHNCSEGLISILTDVFKDDINPSMITNSITKLSNDLAINKVEGFLSDMIDNQDIISTDLGFSNVNSSISNIINKSNLDVNVNPGYAYDLMSGNMREDNYVFNTNDKIRTISSRKSLSKTPEVDLTGDNMCMVEKSDILSSLNID